MTTPEQLQEWREEFYKAFPARPLSASHQAVTDNDYVFAGYLRRCRETEQAIKDAKRETLEEAIAVVQVYEACGSNVASVAVRINNELKGLLK